MKAGKLTEVGKVETVEIPQPKVGPDDILIQVAYTGVCGSDLHSFKGSHPFRNAPVVLGHEVSGTVAAVGKAVEGWSIGEAVAMMPYTHCGECPPCLNGQSNVCVNKVMPGMGDWVGTFATHCVAPTECVFRLGPNTDLKLGALVEPFAVGVHAARRARITAKSDVLVLGGGTIGLMTAAAAINLGARSVAVADLYDFNLDMAKELGVHRTYNAMLDDFEGVIRRDYPEGFEAIFLMSGARVNIGQSLRLAQRGGRIVLAAIYEGDVPLTLSYISLGELEFIGTQIYTAEDYRQAIAWLDSGKLPMGKLITHVMPLEKAQDALLMMQGRTEDSIKILLTP